MALSPESAANVWQALVEQRGQQAAGDLYEMLCGYNADQVGRHAGANEGGALASSSIGWKKIASTTACWRSHDLWEITGKQLMPNPAASSAERKRNMRSLA